LGRWVWNFPCFAFREGKLSQGLPYLSDVARGRRLVEGADLESGVCLVG
jgi:hypothetical protein